MTVVICYLLLLGFISSLARNFLSRAIAGQTLEGIMATLSGFPCTSGFSLNMGRVADMTVLNVEVSPDGIWTTPISGYDYHFNMLSNCH